MPNFRVLAAGALIALAGCTTPYSPAVPVFGSHAVKGIGQLLADTPQRQLDVIMVHGMGTHTLCTAEQSVAAISKALRATLPAALTASTVTSCSGKAQPGPIQAYTTSVDMAGGTIHFKAIVWSPLTAGLKQQLEYNNTGNPSDCTRDVDCKPQRARFNGDGIDFLLNDALADALIYQGKSNSRISAAVAESIAQVLGKPSATPVPVVLITESLGSKIVFDALATILNDPKQFKLLQSRQVLGQRIRLVFMGANQLPILGLADQNGVAPAKDAMSTFLSALGKSGGGAEPVHIVAFTDPNDLLSFRLQPSRYARDFPWAQFSDVLVSNAKTILGRLENPYTAHIGYLDNPDVISIIACGTTKWERCK